MTGEERMAREAQMAKQLDALRDFLREELNDRIGRVVDLAISTDEKATRADHHAEMLAQKLGEVTLALVTADGALAERIERLERESALFSDEPTMDAWVEPSATQPGPKRSLWQRFVDWFDGPAY